MNNEFEPGLYEVTSIVTVRREPKIVEYQGDKKQYITNAVGKLDIGTQRTVYSVVTDKENATWGRISFADSAGLAQWICMKNINRTFVQLVGHAVEGALSFEQRLKNLEVFARTIGYKG